MLSLCFSNELGEREIIDPISSDWYVNAFFTKCNEDTDNIQCPDENIIIVNILDSLATRSNIAKIIRAIADQHPKVLGVDIFLPECNDSANEELLEAISYAKKATNLVVSAYWDDIAGEISLPFFSSILDSTDYGLVNHVNYTQLCTEYRNHPTFSTQIAQKYGINISSSTNKVVNYRQKDFGGDGISNVDSIDIGDISNKIILLGNRLTPSDKKELPFVVRGINQLSGIEILGYEINSLLAQDKSRNIYQAPLDYLSPVQNFVICICSLFFYLFFVFIINYVEDIHNSSWWKILMIIAKLLLLTISELIIIKIWFVLTAYGLIVPDITLFIISIIFVEEIYKKLPNITTRQIYSLLKKMRMNTLKFMLIVIMSVIQTATFGQNYKLHSAYMPVEYEKDGKWSKVRRGETKLNNNVFLRCKSDFTVREVGGAEKLHFCAPSESGKKLADLIDKNISKKKQSIVTTWFRSGTAYEIFEIDSPIKSDSLDLAPYNFHYLIVDVHKFEDRTWGNLGLPAWDIDTIDHSICHVMLPETNYNLKTRKLLFLPQNTTADSINWHMNDLVEKLDENQKNIVMLYLASHGERTKDKKFCFITSDSKYDFIQKGNLSNYISGTTINDYVRRLVEKRAVVLLFVDACYAGTLISELSTDNIIRNGSAAYFMSTDGDLKAYQDSDGSPFADALTKALTSREQLFFNDNNNVVSPYYLELYIQKEVNKKHKGQNPKSIRGNGLGSDFKLWNIKPMFTKNMFEVLLAQAEDGNTDSMVKLGDIYLHGNDEYNITPNYGKAYNYYRTAYAKGNQEATAKVGICHYYGYGVNKDYDEAFKLFSIGASEEKDIARYYLGVCYAKGLGTKKSKKQSKKELLKIEKWYDQDIISAMEKEQVQIPGVEILNNDGTWSHLLGGGFDEEKIVVKIESAVTDGTTVPDIEFQASLGKVKAQALIGKIYLYGLKNTAVNYDKALKWLTKAEKAGNASAICDMGYCYANGYGVPQNIQKAWELYQKAASMGYSPAYVILGNYYFMGSDNVEQNDRDAADNWQTAAHMGDVVGLYKLGLCYKYGIGVEQNETEAIKWLTKSAKKNYGKAQYELGNYYLFAKDYKNAYKWLDKSKKNGIPEAKKLIDQLFFADGKLKSENP